MFYSSPISNKMITFYFVLNEQEVILGGIGAINICSFMTFSFLLAFEVNKTKKTKQKKPLRFHPETRRSSPLAENVQTATKPDFFLK